MADFYVKKGDRLPAFAGYLVGSNGQRPNCTGATGLLKVNNRDTGAVVINSAISFDDAVNAHFTYALAAGDTVAAYEGYAEIEVTFPSTLKQTFPNPGKVGWHVTEDNG
jgi:hypothetical protein